MSVRWIQFLLPLLLCTMVLAGCKPQSGGSVDRVPPNPSAPALYGPPKGTISQAPPSTSAPTHETNWLSSPFHVLHTDLSPAILIHSSTRYLGLFSDLSSAGVGAPSHVAWSTREGPRSFKQGLTQDSTGMEENWLLVWFAGATNWTNWDAPWAVFLQHKPTWTRLDADGLHLEFPSAAGDVVIMPLYGYFKLPPFGRDYLVEHGLKSRKLYSWEWEKGIARDPLARLRFWAGALREFPVYCEETFSVDRARDEVTIRSRFQWHSINDDWNTKHFKLAPISPPLGLVAKDKNFPVRFSKPFFDMELPTPLGPYLAIQDVDAYDATFSVLHYVNETEAFQAPDTNAHSNSALAKLQSLAKENPPSITNLAWHARTLPYLDEQTRSNTIETLRTFLHGSNDASAAFVQALASKLDGTLFDSTWAYAHFSGDWAVVRKLWPELQKHFRAMDSKKRWPGFGIAAHRPGFDEAGECAAFARLAYQTGDMAAYDDGCGRFARELVRLTVDYKGAAYYQSQQPWHSMIVDFLRDDLTGWDLKDLLKTHWSPVKSPDVARFCRDYLRDEIRRGLDQLPRSWERDRAKLQLRAMLLNESPAESAAGTNPKWLGGNIDDVIANCLATLRAPAPRFERLIPPGEPSPFAAAGTTREIPDSSPRLLTQVDARNERAWPSLLWPDWKTPTGVAWSFGRIQPVRDGQPPSMKQILLNPNTEVLTYTLP